ncbi:uncharacterized protein LY89DRAFT_732284 [Mollisia scopiformis]|uniref:F-box domain-containing protein n=1 Tax=Mollisia scopiformis TaxID=149040 RepID=A0A194XEW7_MOLSC|nr:uncharacterized protein LY89DRAFT_732284 [Mollisia scopiformis]KUJ18735.1 hypothetical protein LY89DRAFT_732284 [Mollisia scopiformis]
MLKHLVPYDWRKLLDDIFYRILMHLSEANLPPHTPPRTNFLICSLDPRTRPSIPEHLLRACPSIPRKTLAEFSILNRGIKLKYEKKFSPITKLSNEFLMMILDRLSSHSRELVKPDHRASLSVESFAPIPPQIVYDAPSIDHFSRTCWKFLDLGRQHLFVRISIRFSSEGFEKLRNIAIRPLFALNVKKFSYKIPRFYSQDRVQFERLLREFREPVQTASIQNLERGRNQQRQESRLTSEDHNTIIETMLRAVDQREVIESSMDETYLESALAKFRNLQQVRLMRVQDKVDTGWARFLNRHPRYSDEFGAEDWAVSCEHAAKTLSSVLMKTNNRQLARFSSRFMEPQFPLVITEPLRLTITAFAKRLRYLELEFVDERSHRQERMSELSELFETVFNAAINLQCLHIGFRYRTSAPLRLLLHEVRFRELKHIGLHMWTLDSDELIELLRRHQGLRSIRLRHISLKQSLDEKNWTKVLQFIRSTFPNLKWISLRGIGYNLNTSATTHPMGGLNFAPAFQPHPLTGNNDSDNDSVLSNFATNEIGESDEDETTSQQHEDSDHESASDQHDTDGPGETEADDNHDDNDSDLEEEHHDLSFEHGFTAEESLLANYPPRTESETSLQCECWEYGWDLLDDDGVSVTEDQWRKWQKWVEKSCAIHDTRPHT